MIVKTMQSGDINHLADNVYIEGCDVGCPYCFNPELQTQQCFSLDDVIPLLSETKYVCIMGGEPLMYPNCNETEKLIEWLEEHHKIVILFTSDGCFHQFISGKTYVHLDLKPWRHHKYECSQSDKFSFGMVCDWDYNDKMHTYLTFKDLLDYPIYLKPNKMKENGREMMLVTKMWFDEWGATDVHCDEKIII